MRLLVRFVLVCGATWSIASCSKPNDGNPFSAQDASQSATLFVDSLAENDLDLFRQVARPQFGGVLEESFIVEAGCLDWATAKVAEVKQDFGPSIAWVTFNDGAGRRIRRIAESDGDTVFITSFIDSCEGLDPPPGPDQPDPTDR